MAKPETPALSWHCISHKPTRWALGFLKGTTLHSPVAGVMRQANGAWAWGLMDDSVKGTAPSRLEAMSAVEPFVPKPAARP